MTWLLSVFVKGICLSVAILPRRLQLWLGKSLGLFCFYIVPFRRRIALENISKAFPEWSKDKVWSIARENFKNYGCGFIEFFLMPVLSDKLVSKLIVFEGRDILDRILAQGKGAFFLSAHLGSWEIMSASSRVFKIPFNVITKKIKTGSLNQIWVDMRKTQGLKLISEEKSTFEILRAIGRNETVGFILDQFMGPPVGTKVKFFGHETGAPAALALFAERTKAPVIPVFNVRLPNGQIRIFLEEPVEFIAQGSREQNISFMTQIYTGKIEEIVRKYPEQWLWIHRRWKPFRD
jgi:KDO2-lipid IV(A) lauroyltransferase